MTNIVHSSSSHTQPGHSGTRTFGSREEKRAPQLSQSRIDKLLMEPRPWLCKSAWRLQLDLDAAGLYDSLPSEYALYRILRIGCHLGPGQSKGCCLHTELFDPVNNINYVAKDTHPTELFYLPRPKMLYRSDFKSSTEGHLLKMRTCPKRWKCCSFQPFG